MDLELSVPLPATAAANLAAAVTATNMAPEWPEVTRAEGRFDRWRVSPSRTQTPR